MDFIRLAREHEQMRKQLLFLASLDLKMYVMTEELNLCRIVKEEARKGLAGVDVEKEQ